MSALYSSDMCLHFSVTTSPSTATSDDFNEKVQDVTFNPGETGPIPIDIQVVDDDLVEPTEQFNVSLVSSSIPAVKLGQPAVVNISDNDGRYVK